MKVSLWKKKNFLWAWFRGENANIFKKEVGGKAGRKGAFFSLLRIRGTIPSVRTMHGFPGENK